MSNNKNTFVLSSILLFLLIHMTFEGYIFGSGNALMFLFWLILGVSSFYAKFKNSNKALDKILKKLNVN